MLECKGLRQLKCSAVRATPQNFDHHLCVCKIFTYKKPESITSSIQSLQDRRSEVHRLTCCLAEIHSSAWQVWACHKAEITLEGSIAISAPLKTQVVKGWQVLRSRKVLHNCPETSIQKLHNRNEHYSQELGRFSCGIPNYTAAKDFCKHRTWAMFLGCPGPDEKDIREKEGKGKAAERFLQKSREGTHTSATNLPWP